MVLKLRIKALLYLGIRDIGAENKTGNREKQKIPHFFIEGILVRSAEAD